MKKDKKIFIKEMISKNEEGRDLKLIPILWFILSLIYSILGVYFTGFRVDLREVFQKPFFILHILFIIFALIISIINLIYYSRPRPFKNKVLSYLSVLSALIWFSFLFFIPILENDVVNFYDFFPKLGMKCSRNIAIFGIIPGLFLSFFIRKTYPTKIRLVSLYAALSGALIGVFANHFTCSIDQFWHIVIFHFLPILIFSLIGYFLLSRWSRW